MPKINKTIDVSKFSLNENLGNKYKLILAVKSKNEDRFVRGFLTPTGKSNKVVGSKLARKNKLGKFVLVDLSRGEYGYVDISGNILEPHDLIKVGNRYLALKKNSLHFYKKVSGKIPTIVPIGKEIKNYLFSLLQNVDLHPTLPQFIVTSSRFGAVIEISSKNLKETWHWIDCENGFNVSPNGTFISTSSSLRGNKSKNTKDILILNKSNSNKLRKKLGTASQPTHLNSSSYANKDGGLVLATLFHQGKLILINKRTNKYQTILEGMANPHHIKRISDRSFNSWCVTDTGSGKAYLLNKYLKPASTIDLRGIACSYNGRYWIQQVTPIIGNLFAAVDHIGKKITLFDIKKYHYREILLPPTWYVKNVRTLEI